MLNLSTLQKGLVAHYKFNGNAKDATPYANNGTVYNATLAPDEYNRANKAYSFDGSDDYISLPPQTFSSFSITIRSKLAGGYIISKGTNSNNQFFVSYSTADGGTITNIFIIGGVYLAKFQANNCGLIASDGLWHTITIQSDRTTGEIWVDGVKKTLYGTLEFSSIADSLAGNLWLMRLRNSTSYYSGTLSDIRIYNRMLSATEVPQLHNSYNSNLILNS